MQAKNIYRNAHINAGIQWLNKYHPLAYRWFELIDLSILAMGSIHNCVLGQAFSPRTYWDVIGYYPSMKPLEMGFTPDYYSDGTNDNPELTEAWKLKLNQLAVTCKAPMLEQVLMTNLEDLKAYYKKIDGADCIGVDAWDLNRGNFQKAAICLDPNVKARLKRRYVLLTYMGDAEIPDPTLCHGCYYHEHKRVPATHVCKDCKQHFCKADMYENEGAWNVCYNCVF